MKKIVKMLSISILMTTLSLSPLFSSGSQEEGSGKGGGVEKTTLNFLTYRGDDRKAYDQIISLFEAEYPEIKVNVEYTPGGMDHYQLLKVRALSGKLDLYCQDWGAPFQEMVDTKYAMDLSGQGFIDNYKESALVPGRYDGKIYGISQAESTMVVYYNKAVFNELNLSVPLDWNEFLQVCETIKASGTSPMVLGLSANWLAPNAYYMLMASAKPEMTPYAFSALENREATLNDEPYTTTTSLIKELVDKDYIMKGSAATDPNVAASLVMMGDAAMAIEGTWRIGSYEADENFDFGMFILKAPEGESSFVVWPNQLHMINPKSSHLDESLAFYEFMSRPEIAAIYSNGTSQIPVVKGVVPESGKIQEVLELMDDATPVLNPPINSRNNEVVTYMWDYMTRVFLSEEADDIRDDVQEKIDSVIQ